MVRSPKIPEGVKSVTTLGLLVIAFPLGLFLMWWWTKWPKPVKISITFLPFVLFFLLLLGAFKLGTNFSV